MRVWDSYRHNSRLFRLLLYLSLDVVGRYDGGWNMWSMPGMGGFAIIGLSIAVLVMVAYFILALMGGIGLLKAKEWGRILSIIHAALCLFWAPVGTVIGVLILIYLIFIMFGYEEP